MLLTLWCIVVILISIMAIGVPLRWLLAGCKPLDETAWIQAPFLGIAVIVLILQNLVYIDLPINVTAPIIWILMVPLWIWFYRSRQIIASFRQCPFVPYAAALGVYLLQGLGLLIIGARYYLGRAWMDQFNYTAITQFLIEKPFHTAPQAIGNAPYVFTAMQFKNARIGQSVLQGFFATSTFTDAKTLFEPTILLAPALIVLAVYGLCRRLTLPKWKANLTAAAAGLLPGITMVHLESFFSQALAIPFLLVLIIVLDMLNRSLTWEYVGLSGIILAASVAIYTEFLPVFAGIMFIMGGISAVKSQIAAKTIVYYIVIALSVLFLNPLFVPAILSTIKQVNAQILDHVYPWAFQIEGVSRVWVGDLIELNPIPIHLFLRIYTISATILAYYGLMRNFITSFLKGSITWTDSERRHTFALVSAILALAVLPIIVIAQVKPYPYQFYKLLLSISPLFVVGIALVDHSPYSTLAYTTDSLKNRASRIWQMAPGLVLISGIMAAGATGSIRMVLKTAQITPSERYAAYTLHDSDLEQLQDYLETMHDQNILFYQIDRIWPPGFINAWTAYFARNNHVWVSNQTLNGFTTDQMPGADSIADLNKLPSDMLFLTRKGDLLLAPPANPALWSTVWSNNSYIIWHPTGTDWLTNARLVNANSLDQSNGGTFFWIGQGDTTLDVLAGRAGTLQIAATFLLGPSVENQPNRKLLIIEPNGVSRQLVISEGQQTILIPAQAGMNHIVLRPLDQPTIKVLPNGDTRPLVLGVKNIIIKLADDTAAK